MEDNQQMVVTYTYDPAGALIMITNPDGSVQEFAPGRKPESDGTSSEGNTPGTKDE